MDVADIAIAGLFDLVSTRHPLELLSALVPVDKRLVNFTTLPVGVHDLMRESCTFVNEINSRLSQEDDLESRARLQLQGYVHIMEADFPYMVIWNLLRIVGRERVEWRFTNESGETPLEFVEERICDIERRSKSERFTIGTVLRGMWSREIRNAFAHSQYYIRDGSFWCSLHEMPFADRDISKLRIVELAHIEKLFVAAEHYFGTFVTLYRDAIGRFKDGKERDIHDGQIAWDLDRGGWNWSPVQRPRT